MKIWEIVNLPRSVIVFILYALSPSRGDIQKDLQKVCAGKSGWRELHRKMMEYGGFRNLFYYRTRPRRPILTQIAKIAYRPTRLMGVYADRIGAGMSIWHGEATVIYAKEIGENFAVYQQVTIGRGKTINGNDRPIIGDNVTVYAGAIIVGGVRIGNGAKIGAGAVVVKDVPENAVVVGAPVRVIQK